MKKLLKSNEGFSLVELMVVVAIIGILASVAIPNFRMYQAKSKTSEAKLALASVYTAETSFYTDYDTYATCLNLMGAGPTTGSKRYYAYGFDTGTAALVGPAESGCVAAPAAVTNGNGCFDATRDTGGSGVATCASISAAAAGSGAGTPVASSATATAFVAGAGGNIGNDAGMDQWTIDEDKVVAHTVTSYGQ